MKFRFIFQEQRWHGIDRLCRALGVTRGGYWAWLKRRPSARNSGDSMLLADVQRIYGEGRGKYGSPRIHEALKKAGKSCGKKRIERLMRESGIKARLGKKHKPATTDSTHNMPVAPNVLNRQFQRERPNDAWVTDTTYISTQEGWLYLAVILDLFSRRVALWAMDEHNDTGLVLRALHIAAQGRRPSPGLIHHSDRGSQYASTAYQAALRGYGMVGSMSRKGNCWDNAVIESWFHTLKVELVHDHVFASRRAAQAAIFEYI